MFLMAYLCTLFKIELMNSYKSIISLAIPIIIGQIGTIITGVADTVMVGQHGTQELAASAFVNNVFNLFMIFGVGFTFNFAPLVGRCLAQDDKLGIGSWLRNSLVINTILGFLLALCLALIFINIEKMGQPEELLPLIKPYFFIYGLSIIPILVYTTFRQFVEAVLQPATSMWIFLIGNILNIIGNYILIYGKFGFPELGLLGAGLSTLVSRCLMVVFFVVVIAKSSKYKEYRLGFFESRVSKEKLRNLFLLGMPIGLQQGFEVAAFSATAIMVGWLGFMELAAHQVAITVSAVCYMLYLGLGNAVAIRVSYHRGMNDAESIKKTTYAGVVLSLILSCFVSFILFIGTEQITLFFTEEVAVVEMVVLLLPILMAYVFFDGTQIVLCNSLRGLSDVKAIMYVSAVAYFVVAIPAGYLFGFVADFGISGLWLSYPCGFIFAAVIFMLRFRYIRRNMLVRVSN